MFPPKLDVKLVSPPLSGTPLGRLRDVSFYFDLGFSGVVGLNT